MDQQLPRNPPIARPRHACPERCRRDGWTLDKQAAFIIALQRTRNVTRAAAAAGMSRESAYRLRARPSSAEFAAAWDRALRFSPAPKGHNESHEPHGPLSRAIGSGAREDHKSHVPAQIAPHRQLNQLSPPGRTRTKESFRCNNKREIFTLGNRAR